MALSDVTASHTALKNLGDAAPVVQRFTRDPEISCLVLDFVSPKHGFLYWILHAKAQGRYRPPGCADRPF
eukprot:2789595-Rhodomonas_salina.1